MANKKEQSSLVKDIMAAIGFGAPIMLTVWLFVTIIVKVDHAVIGQMIDGAIVGGLPGPINPGTYAPVLYEFPGVGMIVLGAVLVIAGRFIRSWLGTKIKDLVNYIVAKIPLVGTAFQMIKKVIDQVTAQDENSVEKKPVMVEHLRDDSFAPAFSLGVSSMFRHPRTMEELIIVYFPSAPNPTSGWILLMPASLVHDVEYGADAQMEFILSCGFSETKVASVTGYKPIEAQLKDGQIVTTAGVMHVLDDADPTDVVPDFVEELVEEVVDTDYSDNSFVEQSTSEPQFTLSGKGDEVTTFAPQDERPTNDTREDESKED